MKIAALIVGLVGALLTTGLGARWVSDFENNKELVASMQQLAGSSGEVAAALKDVSSTRNAGYAMIVLGLFAVGAAALVFKQAKVSGGVMIAAALVPAVLAPKSLVFTFFLLIAGTLALVARPKTA